MKRCDCVQNVLVGRFDVKASLNGAITLPQEWRSLLVEDGAVCIVPDLHERCLLLVRKSTLDQEIARLKDQKNDPDSEKALMCITEKAKLVQVSVGGRIVVPIELRESASIGKMVSLVGNVRCVKVWATETLKTNSNEELSWDSIEAAMKE